jgi:hypothetical protein
LWLVLGPAKGEALGALTRLDGRSLRGDFHSVYRTVFHTQEAILAIVRVDEAHRVLVFSDNVHHARINAYPALVAQFVIDVHSHRLPL